MKKIITLLAVLLFAGLSFSQAQTQQITQNADDLIKVKDALTNYVIYAGNLEKENVQLKTDVQKFINDLQLIRTVSPKLDSLLTARGFVKENSGGNKQGNKSTNK